MAYPDRQRMGAEPGDGARLVFDLQSYFDEVFQSCIRGEDDLHDDQREAVDWLMMRPFSALFADVGKGKTVIIETLLDRLFLKGFKGKILIVAPIRVANRVWMREHRLWRHVAYFNPTILRIDDKDPRLVGLKGPAKTAKKILLRMELLDSDSPIHVINKEAVDWLVDTWLSRKRWPYQVVIVDESSCLRDHNSNIFKALQKVLDRIYRFHQLTATPASQTYMHLFSQIYLLDRGERLGKGITAFRERYFTENRFARTWKIRPGGDTDIEEKIADICLVMRREKNFLVRTRSIELPRKIVQQYRDFERDAVLELADVGPIEGVTAAALSNKLLQYASGAVYDENKRYHVIHDEKIEELKQLSEETLDNPVMVAYWYKSSLARLRKAFPQAAIMDREGKMEESWNKGKHKLMFVHPRGSAHGLNLQFGGHHIALFDIFWPLELFTQLIGRLDRQPQQHTVMVHLLSAAGTMDEVVSANLEYLRGAEEDMKRRLQALQRKYRDGRESRQA